MNIKDTIRKYVNTLTDSELEHVHWNVYDNPGHSFNVSANEATEEERITRKKEKLEQQLIELNEAK